LTSDAAFWVVAVVYAGLLFAASAPSPLYVVYQARWHFSAITLTVVFAMYVAALLITLLFAGAVSDHVGRRPTVVLAGGVQVAAMIVFATASDVGMLIAARVLQGVATGLATGALSAWLLDLQPSERPGRGATVSSVAPTAGLAFGAVGAGLLVQYAAAPLHLVYWLLTAFFVLAVGAVLALPETVTARDGWRTAVRPRVGVPAATRGAFVAIVPCLVAVWALSGLFLSLGGSLTAGVLGVRNHVVGGLVVLALAGTGAVGTLLTTRAAARPAMLGGYAALAAGLLVALIGLHERSEGVFFAGSVLAGAGFGPAFTGAFRSVVATAEPSQRAGLVAAIFVVSYLAFSVPAIAAGVAITQVGLLTTSTWYGAALIALTVLAAAATVFRRERPAVAVTRCCPACPGTVAVHPAAATR
jgi:MFS family permease